MPSGRQTRDRIEDFLLARIPFVSVRTSERARIQEILQDIIKSGPFDILVHTLSRGLRDLRTQAAVSDDRSLWGALEFASDQFQSRQNLTVVLTDVPQIGEDNEVTRRFVDLANLAEENSGCVMVITADSVWTPLARVGMSVSLDYPDQDEMLEIIHDFLAAYRSAIHFTWTDEDFRKASTILSGVSKIEAQNVLATLVARRSITSEDLVKLSQAKDSIFSDLAGLERVQLKDQDYRVGGLAGLRGWLARKQPMLTMDLREYGLRPPRGVLLLGIPGCGKSLSAKAIASDWELPLYRLEMGAILGQYVGQSEGRFKEALATADSVAPCVLWIDEIEKGLAGSGSDSTGITTRLVGQFLYWLQESSARVFVVATANDVRSLPQELLRSGRFDDLFFVDLPLPEERREIIQIYLSRTFKGQLIDPSLLDRMVELSDGFAGSDIAAACKEIGEEAVRNELPPRFPDHFAIEAFQNVVPLSRSAPERIEELRRLSDRALPASGAPRPDYMSTQQYGRRVVLQ